MKKKQIVEQSFPFELKQMDEQGRFEGWLSVYGNVDEQGDVVERGAFTKTLKESGGLLPLLWQHDHKLPIGEILVEDQERGLFVKGSLLIEDIRQAREAYVLMKHRIVKGLSIGYRTIADEVKRGVRYLRELSLKEGSVVTFAANPLAMVTGVKSEDGRKDFDEAFARRQLFAAPDQMVQTLWGVLDSILYWSDLSAEEALESAQETIGQFQTAYLEMLPGLLEMIKASPEEFEEKALRLRLAQAAAAMKSYAAGIEAANTLESAAATPDGADGTEPKAVDTSEDEAAALLSRMAEKLTPAADEAA